LALIEDRGFREGKDIEWYAGAIIRHWNYIHIVWMGGIPQYDGGRDHVVFHGRIQTMESLTKELDRLISKAEILDDPHSRRSHKAGKGRGKQQTEAQKMEWAKWQVEADKVWKKQPTWGTPAVARKIHRQFPDVEEDTIRKRIKKPK